MSRETPKVIVQGEQLMVSRNGENSDQAVWARRRQTDGQTPVCKASRLDVISRAWMHDAERRQEAALQVGELLFIPDAAEDLLEHDPGEAQRYVPTHEFLDHRLKPLFFRAPAPAAEDPGQDRGIQENHRCLRSLL